MSVDESSNGKMKGLPLTPTKVVPNGHEGSFEVQWAPVVKIIVGGVVSLLVTLLGTAIVGGIVIYGDLREVKAQQAAESRLAKQAADTRLAEARLAERAVEVAVRAAESVRADQAEHDKWAKKVLENLATKDDLRNHENRGHRRY
jgi:hypothetical protein